MPEVAGIVVMVVLLAVPFVQLFTVPSRASRCGHSGRSWFALTFTWVVFCMFPTVCFGWIVGSMAFGLPLGILSAVVLVALSFAPTIALNAVLLRNRPRRKRVIRRRQSAS